MRREEGLHQLRQRLAGLFPPGLDPLRVKPLTRHVSPSNTRGTRRREPGRTYRRAQHGVRLEPRSSDPRLLDRPNLLRRSRNRALPIRGSWIGQTCSGDLPTHRQGWTISAIARHLGRDRKTIRAYLNGDQVPGQRRQSPDAFVPFLQYCRQRLADDQV
ncbi:helix-turn-helix domain-containing protein [Streptomyces bobili]|uniref:helix-turn-helix domain-containing protein n=1 Tax=Streptomyces bobili TaxID=67280 RepID=UPI0036FEECC1